MIDIIKEIWPYLWNSIGFFLIILMLMKQHTQEIDKVHNLYIKRVDEKEKAIQKLIEINGEQNNAISNNAELLKQILNLIIKRK